MQHFQIRSGRADLAVSMAGEGDALVFLHAGVADRRMWWGQLAEFSSTHTVIAHDRRGFGDTVYKPEPHLWVKDLDMVLEAIGIGHAILVGCSQGARIAVDYALTYPDRVDGLVLVGPAISGAPDPAPFSPRIRALVDEIAAADDWWQETFASRSASCVDADEDYGFTRYHDAAGYCKATDCTVYRFLLQAAPAVPAGAPPLGAKP
jgi:pimeloyl-ACP methyl ester carboxylesterase